jgi:RNA polymerase sigma factor (sigma-70 family)
MPGRATSTATSVRPTAAAETTRELYTRHGQRVHSFCMSRLRNAEEAQDAAQTTFVYVLSALNRGVVPRNELAWLLTIADNVCRSTRRSLGRRLARLVNTDVDELEAAVTSISAETNETLDALREALGELPDNQRRAILLREWQGLSYADIADQLQLSVAAVETLLFRARRGIAARLERQQVRIRALDLGSVLALVRSIFCGAAGKVAVGAAGVALVASVPGGEHRARAGGATVAPIPTAAPATGFSRPATAPEETARRLPGAVSAKRIGTRRSRAVRRPTVGSVRATVAVQTPASETSRRSSPAIATVARSHPVAVTPPVSVRATSPVAPPLAVPAAVQGPVAAVTQSTGTVVASVTQAVPVLPGG